MKDSGSDLRPTERDIKILQHVRAYRITTTAVLQRVFFPGKSDAAVKSTLRRLCGEAPHYRFLRPAPLDSRHVYYQLTYKGTRFLGCSSEVARPLGVQSRIRRFAVLSFIHLDETAKRIPFEPARFPEQFPMKSPLRRDFFIEEAGEKMSLGFVLVDYGASPNRMIRKVSGLLYLFLRMHWFDDYVRDGTFLPTILTFTDGKKAMLERGLEWELPKLAKVIRNNLPSDTLPVPRIQIKVIPGMQNLVP